MGQVAAAIGVVNSSMISSRFGTGVVSGCSTLVAILGG